MTTDSLDRFSFHMTWFVPPSVLFGNEKNSIIANMGLKSQTQRATSLSIDNQSKLKLEDIAIARLEKEIKNNQMCKTGYTIQTTKWLERSILFKGSCVQNISEQE